MKTKEQSLKSLIDEWKFDYVNFNILTNFSLPERKYTDYKLFHFDREISSEDAIKEIEKEGYLPANIIELLSWKEWNEKDNVVALGSVAKLRDGRHVVYLGRRGLGRNLSLDWFGCGWDCDDRFLAVRNLNLKNSDTLNSSLSLKHFVACPHCREELLIKIELKI